MATARKGARSLPGSTSRTEWFNETGFCAESFLEQGSLSVLSSLYHRGIASNRPYCIFDHDYGI